MDKLKISSSNSNTTTRNNNNKENAFEYTYPDDAEPDRSSSTEDPESNKSTPYYTPLEFLQTSFEFPSPTTTTETPTQYQVKATINVDTKSSCSTVRDTVKNTAREFIDLEVYDAGNATDKDDILPSSPRIITTTRTFTLATPKQQYQQQQPLLPRSPSVGRKFKRFSLYDRRSCSPQHLVARSSASLDERDNDAAHSVSVDNNKENTVPKCSEKRMHEDAILYLSNSEHSSPISLKGAEDAASPNDANRVSYSPKLLASINNLNITGGSPLGLINSAGYKNGNFFRFPEIDHVAVQDVAVSEPSYVLDDSRAPTLCLDNAMRLRQKHQHQHQFTDNLENTSPTYNHHHHQKSHQCSSMTNTTSSDMGEKILQTSSMEAFIPQREMCEQTSAPCDQKCIIRNNSRKNRKNKNNLTIRITDVPVKSSAQVSPMPKPRTPTIKSTKEKARSLDSAANENELSVVVVQHINESHASCDEIDAQIPVDANTYRMSKHDTRLQPDNKNPSNIYSSTSLSQLDAHNQPSSSTSSMSNKRTSRRKSPCMSSTSDWLSYHRKHNPYYLPQTMKLETNTAQSSLDSDVFEYSSGSPQKSAGGCELQSATSTDSGRMFGQTLLPTPRGMHKHNQMLHSSSTNLKTLPECLTLVEFTTSNSPGPFKQKSMELPVSTHTNLPSMQAKNTGATSSMNLLQRRGSNHSLTLNLHSSCGNLMNSALSVSNYSLGSVNNFNTILNSKSSSNLESAQVPAHHPTQGSATSQGTRQSLFRRRGSNHSITLKGHTTNSCSDLNTLAAGVHVTDKYRLNCPTISRTSSVASTGNMPNSNTPTPKRGLLERRGSNQSLTLNMSSMIGSSPQHLGDTSHKAADAESQNIQLHAAQKPNICTCAASQATHQRKFFSTENLIANRSSQQFYGYKSPKAFCFGSASDLKPSEYSVESVPTMADAEQVEDVMSTVCTCSGVVVGNGMRNIMTRPLSPQTTSEEFKIYLAGIQMLQSASTPLNQYDLIKLNYVFDNSYKSRKHTIEPPILGTSRDMDTPTGQQPITSEDCELLSLYEAIIERIAPAVPCLNEEDQKRIFRELHKEFWDLPLNHQEKPMVFGSQTKNRYKTILPNEHSRVMLESESKELQNIEQIMGLGTQPLDVTSEDMTTDYKKVLVPIDDAPYINANYIKGPDYVSKCYVATQGPMPNTIYDFWLMIYQNTQRYIRKSIDGGSSSSPHVDKRLILQQYYQKIIMLTNLTENSRQKCAIYFPIELNEVIAVAAKQEIFQLSSVLKHFFEPYLSVTNASSNNVIQPDDIGFSSANIAVESCKVILNEKCYRDLPADGINFFLIKNVGIVRRNGYSIRKFVLLYCISVPNSNIGEYYLQKIYCYHYWYPDWPDHHSPRDINTLLDTCLHILNLGKCESEFDNYDETMSLRNAHLLAQRVELYRQDIFNAVQPLPVIHCSAGIGRTGCFTAMLNAVRQFRQSLAHSLTAMTLQSLTTADTELTEKVNDDESNLNHNDKSKHEQHDYISEDSSFTRNTQLYIMHILKTTNPTVALKSKSEDVVDVANVADDAMIKLSFENLPKIPEIYVDILGIVCNLRLQRGGMVQNSEQYELIHRSVCLYLKRTLTLRRF